jgi:hypothetical protein
MRTLNCPLAPVSWGELIDKITILAIKAERLQGSALVNVLTELRMLQEAARPVSGEGRIDDLTRQLRRVNESLWAIEDEIRLEDSQGDFGPNFIALARSVYKTNDLRAALKREINLLLDSPLIEEKSYSERPIFFTAARPKDSPHAETDVPAPQS